MKLSKYVQTLWIRKDSLTPKHKHYGYTIHACGPVEAQSFEPQAVCGLPRTYGVFVEYQAVKTLTVKLNKKSLRVPRKRGRVSK